MSASERHICSMYDVTVFGSVAYPLELLAGGGLGRVALRLRAVGAPDDDLAAVLGDGDEVELAGDLLVDLLGDLLVDLGRLRVGDRQTARLAECLRRTRRDRRRTW